MFDIFVDIRSIRYIRFLGQGDPQEFCRILEGSRKSVGSVANAGNTIVIFAMNWEHILKTNREFNYGKERQYSIVFPVLFNLEK